MKHKKILLVIAILLVVSVIGVGGYQTYAKYIGSRTGTAAADVAFWNVQIEGEDVNAGTPTAFTKTVNWVPSDNVVGSLIAPGRTGEVEIAINPNQTEVAIDYYIKVDKPVSLNNSNISISGVTVGENVLTLLDSGEYSGYYYGVIELPGTSGNKTAMTEAEMITAKVDISWVDGNTTEANAADTVTGKAQPSGNLDFIVVVEQKTN